MVFPGHGGQKLGMARELYRSERVFRDSFDTCTTAFAPHIGVDLPAVLFGETSEATESAFSQLPVSHAAIFSVEISLHRFWESWVSLRRGRRAQSGKLRGGMRGGDLHAARCGGDRHHRSRLLETLPSGGMLAVSLPESEVSELLTDGISLGVVNGPDQCVVSGHKTAITGLAARLRSAESTPASSMSPVPVIHRWWTRSRGASPTT
ncbi:acyltransferase domain-containing protein [Streptomyces sp. M10(2022)]